MTLISILSVLFATAFMGFIGLGKAGEVADELEIGSSRRRALPKRWSSFLIVMTVVYFFLLLAGLCYAGWFRVA